MKGTSAEIVPVARILLVDDNKLGLIARKAVLEDAGHRITTALEGQEAFERFAREKFELVITDYKMPRMNGLELIRRIRERSETVPIILISGYAEALGMTKRTPAPTWSLPRAPPKFPSSYGRSIACCGGACRRSRRDRTAHRPRRRRDRARADLPIGRQPSASGRQPSVIGRRPCLVSQRPPAVSHRPARGGSNRAREGANDGLVAFAIMLVKTADRRRLTADG